MSTKHVFGPQKETGVSGGKPWGEGTNFVHTGRRWESTPRPQRCEVNMLTTKPTNVDILCICRLVSCSYYFYYPLLTTARQYHITATVQLDILQLWLYILQIIINFTLNCLFWFDYCKYKSTKSVCTQAV